MNQRKKWGIDFIVDALGKIVRHFYGFGAQLALVDERSSWASGMKSFSFFSWCSGFLLHSFDALWTEKRRRSLFSESVMRGNQRILAKEYCVCDESGKEGRVIWKPEDKGMRRKECKGVPASFHTVEDFVERKIYQAQGQKSCCNAMWQWSELPRGELTVGEK